MPEAEVDQARKDGRRRKLEIAYVLSVVAILSVFAVPSLLRAVHRGKQKRTMGDMRTIATAVESYSIDFNAYPRVGSITALAALTEPTFVKRLPLRDGWGNPYRFESDGDEYSVSSAGPDGRLQRPELRTRANGAIDEPTTAQLGGDALRRVFTRRIVER
jgi:type II secretory pathway pseudopilin PulG